MNPLVFFSLVVLYLGAAARAQQAAASQDGLLVQTPQGSVNGAFTTHLVRQFLGIPYASAQRWKPPAPAPKRNTTLAAVAYGNSCPQQLTPSALGYTRLSWTGTRDNEIFIPESEDCHTVNIWTPSVDRKQGTAVLVWIHGGAFAWGASNLGIYNGSNMVRDNDDITLVSFNYRLNIFGQPNAPQFVNASQTQNFGLLDMRAAVEWVHANIAPFGGDPERITIFGQSAGAVAVEAYSFTYPNDTIVKGLIGQSGNVIGFDISHLSNNINTTSWNVVAEMVGCGKVSNPDQVSCMEKVPTAVLENATIASNAPFNNVGDDITYPRNSAAQLAAGHYLHVPLLLGSNENERDPFLVAAELIQPGFVLPAVSRAMVDIQTSFQFTCPDNATISFRVRDAEVPTFRYQYQATTQNLFQRQDLRAFHGSEIPLVFGTYNHSGLVPTHREILLSKFIQTAWVSFARDPARGLVDLGWPRYSSTGAGFVEIGNAKNLTGFIVGNAFATDAACSLGDTVALNSTYAQLMTLLV